MIPGEIWELEDGSRRVILSTSTYNVSALNRVVTAVVAGPVAGFEPLAVPLDEERTQFVYADRLAMHPRHWLRIPIGPVPAKVLAEVRAHLEYLLCR